MQFFSRVEGQAASTSGSSVQAMMLALNVLIDCIYTYTVIIRINAAFITFLALKMQRLFEGGVYSGGGGGAFIANLVTTTANLLSR